MRKSSKSIRFSGFQYLPRWWNGGRAVQNERKRIFESRTPEQSEWSARSSDATSENTSCPDGGMVDTKDSKSFASKACGFKSRSGHQINIKKSSQEFLRGFFN